MVSINFLISFLEGDLFQDNAFLFPADVEATFEHPEDQRANLFPAKQ